MPASPSLDLNWLNIASLLTASFLIFLRPIRKWWSKNTAGGCWKADKAVMDFLNGLCIVPFAAMPASIPFPSLLKTLTDNPMTLAAAGVVGAIYALGEAFSAGSS